MNDPTPSTRGRAGANLWRAGLLGGLLALLLASCGGGVETGGTGAPPVGYAAGPIDGFGSVIVNGVRFDDSSAQVLDEDGNLRSRDALKLGMTVQIDSGAIDRAAGTAVASKITYGSDLLGRVDARDTAGGSLVVMGQTVVTGAATVFDDRMAGGLGAVAVGSTVEVYAVFDPVSGTYAARRIEPAASPALYRVRGLVSSHNPGARTFRIGSQTFTYAEGAAPAGLAEGAILLLKVQTARNTAGQWVVASSASGARQPEDGADVEIESVISLYASQADFVAGGVRIDATNARVEPAGAVLAAGVFVEVEGQMAGGRLVATKLEVKSASGDDEGGDEFEVSGAITSLDTAQKRFVVRGVTVDYSGDVRYEDGSEAELAVGQKVEVQGVLSADGTRVLAEEIQFDD
jgi:Domain of unknown function (DUF5666)